MTAPVRLGDGTYAPDPIRDWFIRGARNLLDRAYADPGVWKSTVLGDPDDRQAASLRRLGIDPHGPDNTSAGGGRSVNNARTRWARAFVRCVHDQHRWHSAIGGGAWRAGRRSSPRTAGAIRVEVGERMPALGKIRPRPGRAIRIIYLRGGQSRDRAVARLPRSRRIFTDEGTRGSRWSDPDLRDW